MSYRLRLIDLFAGGGGCSVGYDRAGFDVEGVDCLPHPDYPFKLHGGDAMDYLHPDVLNEYDAAHASPPCPRYSSITPDANRDLHPDLVSPLRTRLQVWGGPYIIENVVGAPLENPILLCGSMFGLGVRRHRLFETNVPMLAPQCRHDLQPEVWGVYGDHGDLTPVTRPDGTSRGNKARDVTHAQDVMGIDWMTTWDDLADAIPPAYTEWLGAQVRSYIESGAAA